MDEKIDQEDSDKQSKEDTKKGSSMVLIILVALLVVVASFLVTGFVLSKNKNDVDLKVEDKVEVEVPLGEVSVETTDQPVEQAQEEQVKETEEAPVIEEKALNVDNTNYRKVENIDVTNRYIHPVTGQKLTQMEENAYKEGYVLPKDINSRVFIFLDDYVIENIEEYKPGTIRFNIGKTRQRKGEDLLSKPVIFDFEYHNLLNVIGEDETYEFDEFKVQVKELEELNTTGYIIRNK